MWMCHLSILDGSGQEWLTCDMTLVWLLIGHEMFKGAAMTSRNQLIVELSFGWRVCLSMSRRKQSVSAWRLDRWQSRTENDTARGGHVLDDVTIGKFLVVHSNAHFNLSSFNPSSPPSC